MGNNLQNDSIEEAIKELGSAFDDIKTKYKLTPADAHYVLERLLIDKFIVLVFFCGDKDVEKFFELKRADKSPIY